MLNDLAANVKDQQPLGFNLMPSSLAPFLLLTLHLEVSWVYLKIKKPAFAGFLLIDCHAIIF